MSDLYLVQSGARANSRDLNQLTRTLNGQNDAPFTSYQPLAAPGAPTPVVSSASGVLNGAYAYLVVWLTGNVDGLGTIHWSGNHTAAGTQSAVVNPADNAVDLSAIAIGPAGVVARALYRTKAGGSTFYYLDTIDDNVTTDYTDNTADSGLGTATAPTTNTTGSPPQIPVYDAVPGYTAPVGSLAFVNSGGLLLLYQSTGTGWEVSAPPIPNASTTAPGIVELAQNPVSGTPIGVVRVADAEEVTITTAAAWTTIASYTPSVDGFFNVDCHFRLTASSDVEWQATYAGSQGAATTVILNNTSYTYTSGADNDYDVIPVSLRAVTDTAILIQCQASVASAVVASANIVGR